MKQMFALIAILALSGSLKSFQAGSAPQNAPAAPAGKTAEQQKADQSGCIEWAKQQAGLSHPDAKQPAATSGSEKTGAAPANPGAAPANQGAPQANQGAATKPADNAGQSNSLSGITSSAINAAESKLGISGAANSKVTQLAKDAYAECMQKKGYKTK